MKNILAALILACMSLMSFAKGTAVYYVARQELHALGTQRVELYGRQEGSNVYMDVITYPDGHAEVNYKCGWSGTWMWNQYAPSASAVTTVPEGSLSEGTCYQLNDPSVPVLPDLYLQ